MIDLPVLNIHDILVCELQRLIAEWNGDPEARARMLEIAAELRHAGVLSESEEMELHLFMSPFIDAAASIAGVGAAV